MIRVNKNITKDLNKLRKKWHSKSMSRYLSTVVMVVIFISIFILLGKKSVSGQESTQPVPIESHMDKSVLWSDMITKTAGCEKNAVKDIEDKLMFTEKKIVKKIDEFAAKVEGDMDLSGYDFNGDGKVDLHDRITFYKCDINGDGYIDHKDAAMFRSFDSNKNGRFDMGEDFDGDGVLDVDETAFAVESRDVWQAYGAYDVDKDGRCDIKEDKNGNGRLDPGEVNGKMLMDLDVDGNGVMLVGDVEIVEKAALAFSMTQSVYADLDGNNMIDKDDIKLAKAYYRLAVKYMHLLSPETLRRLDKNTDGRVNAVDMECVVDGIIRARIKRSK